MGRGGVEGAVGGRGRGARVGGGGRAWGGGGGGRDGAGGGCGGRGGSGWGGVACGGGDGLPGVRAGGAGAGGGLGGGLQAPRRVRRGTAAPTHGAGLLSTVDVGRYVAFGVRGVIGGLLEPAVGLVPVMAGCGAVVVRGAAVARVLQVGAREAAVVEEQAAEVLAVAVTGSVRVASAD